METRKTTTAGVLSWTPAPVRTSSTSSVTSEDAWEDEDEEQAEKDDDFVSRMDENGIIGLSEALEDIELGDADAECNPNLHAGPLNPEEANLSRHERETLPEELSYSLSEPLSHTESSGEDVQMLSPSDELKDSLKAWTVEEEVRQRKGEQGMQCLSENDMTEEEKDGVKAGMRSGKKRNKYEHSYISKGGIEKISSIRSCSAHLLDMEAAGASSHHRPISQPASAVTVPTFPHLLHFTAEEIAAAPGIEAEILPEMSFIESLSESHRSHVSLETSPRGPKIKLRASLQPATMFSEELKSNHLSGVSHGPLEGSVKSDKHKKQPTPSPRKMRQRSPEAIHSRTRSVRADLKLKHQTTSPDGESRTPRARTDAAEVDESRKGPLSYRTPDFSMVEPKVHFPKGGYKPPKSKCSSKRDSLSPEPPLVFKSPADIVKEVLLNTTDGSPASSDYDRLPTRALNSTVPQEFRCRQQATTLLDQLQEDYNRLLTKYAEAENTIDRLRLEAKDRPIEIQRLRPRHCHHSTGRAVNLYSDPPKPGHPVQSGLHHGTSKVMTLDFPRAQRTEINSASLHPNGHSSHQRSASAGPSTRSPEPQVGQQLAKILYSQADKFLQQMQTFEDLLKSEKLKPFEQMKGLSQLAAGLDSLERGYLLARDEHKLLQQRDVEINHFDPERELEGLIFQCGLHMEDLKEHVEQTRQEQPTCEAPPSPPRHPTPLSVPSEGGETLTHPQSPPVPLLVDPGEAAAVEVSSASEESDEEEAETEDEETLNSLYLKALNGKYRRVEQDFDTLTDRYQSFKELPKLLDHSQREGAPVSAALRTNMQLGDEEKERQGRGTGNLEAQKSLPKSKKESRSPSCKASSQSTMPRVRPASSRRRLEVGKSRSSSLSSLGDITAPETRSSKLHSGNSSGVLSQDGIISPETDSGFVGSESSRLTPAAAPCPLHQRASESVSAPQEGKPEKPQTGPVSAPSPASSPSHSRTAMEPKGGSRLSAVHPRRTRQGQRRRTFSCSPQRWVSQTEQSNAGTSEFGLESDSNHTVSEDGQNNQCIESTSSSPSSSPTAWYYHGDSLRALSFSQGANRNDAIQTLQTEVTRLKERLESCLRNKKPLSSVRAALAQENYTHLNASTPRVRSGVRLSDASRGRRDRRTVEEVEESTLRRTTRKRPPSTRRQEPQPNMLTEPSTSRPLVSRCTQTSAAVPESCGSHTKAVRSRTHPRQHPGVSVQVSETADEPDSRSRHAPLCPQCLSRHRGRPERPVGGDTEPTHSSRCRHRLLCGCPDPYQSTGPDSPTHTSYQPAETPNRAAKSSHFAAATPTALLQCMPVCPPPLLLYSTPLYVSPSNDTGTSSGVRGHREVRARTRRSMSADKQRSLDSSLNRAIRAARHMKHTSRHMARSLATGLHYQEQLTQSCSY
ncbi:microtubule organization protein AKNA isoform X3 [Micropterus dolomieu]|uniref:microtubule organization protein AKNA isoform X3 n=1 Tax=Micropterus dolomieu TaxID=147949 RepID=UPI001E8E4EE4|nr:microtubule organization protein AKNA isoform X3 [Micropterus dolomieu]